MTRIRYTWYWQDSLLVSEPILAGNDTYEISITFAKHIEYFIQNSRGKIVCQEECESIPDAKKKAKKEIIKLGAVIFDEVRRRKK